MKTKFHPALSGPLRWLQCCAVRLEEWLRPVQRRPKALTLIPIRIDAQYSDKAHRR